MKGQKICCWVDEECHIWPSEVETGRAVDIAYQEHSQEGEHETEEDDDDPSSSLHA